MSLKAKLLGGFGVMILFAIIIAAVNTHSNLITRGQSELQATAYVPEIQSAERLSSAVFDSGEQFATYQNTFDDAVYAAGMERVGTMEEASLALADILKEHAANLPVLAREIAPLNQRIALYRKAAQDMHGHAAELPALYEAMAVAGEGAGALILEHFKDYRNLAEEEMVKFEKPAIERRMNRYDTALDILNAAADARRKIFELQAARLPARQTELYNEAVAMMADIQKAVEDMRASTIREAFVQRCTAILGFIGQWNGYVNAIYARTTGMNEFSAARQAVYDELLVTVAALSGSGMASIDRSSDAIAERIRAGLFFSSALAIAALVAGIVIALWITRSITRPINRIIADLTHESELVEESVSAFKQTSSTLAEDTSSQAATLEETNANLEEMASATEQSALDSQKTQDITMETIARIKSESESMHTMSEAMEDINGQADKISNIIKTIEEIAFQTNLLALNAAVEAARAGEAGKGFAVVADEVRNLAGRSASAAKDTGELIRATVESVHRGAEVTRQLEEGFTTIRAGSETIGGLVNQINESTQVQAGGVKQFADAIMRMDQVTQEISRMSMDAANGAKSLDGETASLRETVGHLIGVVHGAKSGPQLPAVYVQSGSDNGKKGAKKHETPALPTRKALPSAAPAQQKSEPVTVSDDDVIPLGDGDDF